MSGAAWLLPLAPRPCPRETMSSWLSRIGCRYGLRPSEVLDSVVLTRSTRHPAPSTDWRVPSEHIAAMAEGARLPVAAVAALDAAVTFPDVPQYGFAWAYGVRDPVSGRDIYGGPLGRGWCPSCHAEQFRACGQEYMLPDWALAYSGHCFRHEVPLADRCPACGSDKHPMHIPDRARTRLACAACGEWISGQRRSEAEPSTAETGVGALLLAFERHLVRAAAGRAPSRDWAGSGSGAALLALVDDIACVLCPERAFKLGPLIHRFDLKVGVGIRDVLLPDLEHPLCGLPPRGRLRMLAAVLAVIGGEEACSLLLGDGGDRRASARHPNDQLGGSMEWLVRVLTDRDLVRLLERSQRWPLQAHARLRRAVLLSGRADDRGPRSQGHSAEAAMVS